MTCDLNCNFFGTKEMDFVLRKLDELQEALYDLEDFLESHRENEVLEFVSDHWKECLLGGLVTFLALYQGCTFITKRRNLEKIKIKRAQLEEKKRQLHWQLTNNETGKIYTLERETILSLEIEELLAKLKNGELDPVAVLEAYQARAL